MYKVQILPKAEEDISTQKAHLPLGALFVRL